MRTANNLSRSTAVPHRKRRQFSTILNCTAILSLVSLIILSITQVQPILADGGGITGYVVGSDPVALYTCPDTAKCASGVTLPPGTQVQIADNVVGAPVPGGDNAWRKILYQGQYFYVPLRFITVNPAGAKQTNLNPDISFVSQPSGNGNTPNFPSVTTSSSFSSAPVPADLASSSGPSSYCPAGYALDNNPFQCCPIGATLTNNTCTLTVTTANQVTQFTVTDGRINGLAGDRIAIYCRSTGRIEVWAINNSIGDFLVSFNHDAVSVAGAKGFTVTVGSKGTVAINSGGQGTYWAAISGGPYHATGQGDFAKVFSCYAS